MGWWGRQSIQNRHFCAQKTGLVGIWDWSAPRVPFFDPKKRDNVQFTCVRHSASRFLRPKNGRRCHFGVVGSAIHPKSAFLRSKSGTPRHFGLVGSPPPVVDPKKRDSVQFRCVRDSPSRVFGPKNGTKCHFGVVGSAIHPKSAFLRSKNGTRRHLGLVATPRPVF